MIVKAAGPRPDPQHVDDLSINGAAPKLKPPPTGGSGPLTHEELLEGIPDIVVVIDEFGRLEFVGEAVRRLLGHEPRAWEGRDVFELIHPDDVGLAAESLVSSVDHGPGSNPPVVLRIADLRSQWHSFEIVSTVVAPVDRADRLVVVARELAPSRPGGGTRRALDHRFERAFEHAPIGMALVAQDGMLTRANAALERMIGSSRVALTGTSVLDLVHPEDRERTRRHALVVAGDDLIHEIEVRFLRRDRTTGWAHVTSTRLRDDDGRPEHTVMHLQDITEQRRLHDELEFAANHDPLTGLLNRAGFERRFDRCEDRSAMRAIVVVDLDRFKPVNDRHGHAAGDALLRQVSERLRSSARAGDSIGRLGGDEFTLLACGIDSTQSALAFGERVRSRLAEEFVLDKGTVSISGSIGVALLDGPVPLDGALAAADRAAYEIKRDGGNAVGLTWCCGPTC